ERVVWMGHGLAGGGALEHETDRARFLGRGRTAALPLALSAAAPLSETTGSVLDPVMSLRRTVVLGAGEATELTTVLGAAPTREAALVLAGHCASPAAVDTALARAADAERALLARLRPAEDHDAPFPAIASSLPHR